VDAEDGKADATASSRFEVFVGMDGQYYFHAVAQNGRIVIRSEGYTTSQAAERGVASVRANGLDAGNYRLLQARSGEWYFTLLAKNHEVIASSEMYTRRYSAARGVSTAMAVIAEADKTLGVKEGSARFQIFAGADQRQYFHLRGGNGEIMLASEGYSRLEGALHGIAAVRENGQIAQRYEVVEAASGRYFFRLRAANNEIIALGQAYANRSGAARALDALVSLFQRGTVADPVCGGAVCAPTTTAGTRSVGSYPDLARTLQALSDIAAGGSSLEYFGFAENVSRPATARCRSASAEEAARAFDELADMVMEDGNADVAEDFTDQDLARGKAAFRQLLGNDEFEICSGSSSGCMSVGSMLYIIGQGEAPRLSFETAWED
jgi:uncharacterized protein YegP (UPF0339 family)